MYARDNNQNNNIDLIKLQSSQIRVLHECWNKLVTLHVNQWRVIIEIGLSLSN